MSTPHGNDIDGTVPANGPLTGRTALVTGGGRGIGAEISRGLARAGARVALLGNGLEHLTRLAGELPHDPIVVRADLSRPEAPEAALREVTDRFGRLDILVNNAGFGTFGPSDEVTPEMYDDFMAVNLRAPLLLAGQAARHMADHGGGSIVHISSGIGASGNTGWVLYSAAKGGMEAAARTLTAEWGPHNVRFNTVRPAVIRTSAAWPPPGWDEAAYLRSVPLRRMQEATDVADAVLFLAGDSARNISGAFVDVDGGWGAVKPSVVGADA
ncbi:MULTISPECIES: SDR family NAD(P)-dependent oxidoreductase [Catenuloplanes]|uniref:NAD(P)-dependent dehydrogenase (Short-subunit alcohol dehydrogenase family) n=1 Tax=Catenuloplanes niger TaxID=587534 RepID=A0AAE4CWZ1_9ACTN|nr:SDR family NAD(P)-dependent oxidoreductase [Catenuloplanes niger]MDR7327700.1 NAD(P)-dependent dehydrogenase (short-subunit alcohol dehydrogenase family) [Catenuloplanes niger]